MAPIVLTRPQLKRHEHLYKKIERSIIRTDDLHRPGALEKVEGAQVILCTLDTISNPKLREFGFTQAVPINRVVIDEASQIEIGQYLPLFEFFGDTLRKLCFIGDDQQCEVFLPFPLCGVLILHFLSLTPLQYLLTGMIA